MLSVLVVSLLLNLLFRSTIMVGLRVLSLLFRWCSALVALQGGNSVFLCWVTCLDPFRRRLVMIS